ncbi:MAG: cytochrome c3 family protein [Anaeromyxobacter sp.]
MTRKTTLGVLVAGLLAGGAVAGELPNLPKGQALVQAKDSPGVVTFNHDMHVDGAHPSCLGCHPQPFGILGRSGGAQPLGITHEKMEKGQACGACHDGKKAFGLDDCSMCHAE